MYILHLLAKLLHNKFYVILCATLKNLHTSFRKFNFGEKQNYLTQHDVNFTVKHTPSSPTNNISL